MHGFFSATGFFSSLLIEFVCFSNICSFAKQNYLSAFQLQKSRTTASNIFLSNFFSFWSLEMIAALQTSESDQNYKLNLTKASSKLGRAQSEVAIRQLIARLMQKSCADLYVSVKDLRSDV